MRAGIRRTAWCRTLAENTDFLVPINVRGRLSAPEEFGNIVLKRQAAGRVIRLSVMTSVAFIAGAVPLLISHGAGGEVRSATGVTVFAGMLGVTLFGLFLTPVFY